MLTLALVLSISLPPADQARFDAMWNTVVAAYDTSRGGYVTKDGTPIETAMELSLRMGVEGQDPEATDRAIRTLEWTIGLFDSVGGGFLSRARDADPGTASFDKMTLPNSRRLELLVDATTLTGSERYRRFGAQTVDYFDRVLLDGRGGFVHGQVGDRQLIPESNGAAIRAWLEWGAVVGNVRFRDFAWKSLDRSWEECWMGTPGMVRRGFFGELTEAPRLVDQIEMGRAYLIAAHLAGREVDLARAIEIADTMLLVYQDPEKGGFRTRATANRKGIIRKAGRELDENARAARFLAELAAVAGQSRYRDAARRTLDSFTKEYEKASVLEAAEVALAIRAIASPDLPPRPEWKEPVSKRERTARSTRFKLKRR